MTTIDDLPAFADENNVLNIIPFARPENKIPELTFFSQSGLYDEWLANESAGCIPTGIAMLDEVLHGGIPANSVTGIVGPTGSGKSELVRRIRSGAAKSGIGVVYVDIELGISQLMIRDLSEYTRIPSKKLRDLKGTGQEKLSTLTVDQRMKFLSWLGENESLPILTCECPGGLEIHKVFSSVLTAVEQVRTPTGCLVILDSLHRLAPGMPGTKDPRNNLTDLTYKLDAMTKEHGFTVLTTFEKNRADIGEDPTIEEQRSSIAEFRAEYTLGAMLYLQPMRDDGEAAFTKRVRVSVAKCREGIEGWTSEDLILSGPCWDMKTATNFEPDLAERIIATIELQCFRNQEGGRAGTTKSQAIVAAMDLKRTVVLTELRRLVATGEVLKHGTGPGTTYSLPGGLSSGQKQSPDDRPDDRKLL